jgi:hypothetical protein
MRLQCFFLACALVLAAETHAHSRDGVPNKHDGKGANRKADDHEYAVVIDAGSVASTIHVYSFYWKESHAYPHVFLPGKRTTHRSNAPMPTMHTSAPTRTRMGITRS